MGLFDICLLVLGILHDENGYFLLGIQRVVCLNSWNSASVLSVSLPLKIMSEVYQYPYKTERTKWKFAALNHCWGGMGLNK